MPAAPKESQQIRNKTVYLGRAEFYVCMFYSAPIFKTMFWNELSQEQSIIKRKNFSKSLQMLLFESPWILMGSSLFEMVYPMDFHDYFTLIESQQKDEHKANRKVLICNLTSVSFCCPDQHKGLSI